MDLISLVKKWEGLKLNAYQCQAGVWTIGYGHTKNVKRTSKLLNEHEAESLLNQDLDYYRSLVKMDVEQYAKSFTPSACQIDAITSFVFNLGWNQYLKSTLRGLFLKGEVELASQQFLRWVWITDPHTGQKFKSKGLINRRTDEMNMFNGVNWSPCVIAYSVKENASIIKGL